MDDGRLDNLIRRWATLGVMFDADPLDETPDLERTLLETARLSPKMARLFVTGATWLHTYADLVARHRLVRLIGDELEPEHRPVLGLLLDIAQQGTHPPRFRAVLAGIDAAADPRPLFDIERASPSLQARAERRASDLSKMWNLWCEPIEFKHDALRPAAWVMTHNPGLVTRADFRGDLRASVLASLRYDEGAGRSELALARACGGSRAQVRNALANLRMTARVARNEGGRGNGWTAIAAA